MTTILTTGKGTAGKTQQPRRVKRSPGDKQGVIQPTDVTETPPAQLNEEAAATHHWAQTQERLRGPTKHMGRTGTTIAFLSSGAGATRPHRVLPRGSPTSSPLPPSQVPTDRDAPDASCSVLLLGENTGPRNPGRMPGTPPQRRSRDRTARADGASPGAQHPAVQVGVPSSQGPRSGPHPCALRTPLPFPT